MYSKNIIGRLYGHRYLVFVEKRHFRDEYEQIDGTWRKIKKSKAELNDTAIWVSAISGMLTQITIYILKTRLLN